LKSKKKIKVKSQFIKDNNIVFNDDMVLYAFRYCLGRRTYVVQDMVSKLIEIWELLGDYAQDIIRRDIISAIEHDRAGDNCDVAEWQKVLDLK